MSCPNHPQWIHSREDCPLCDSERLLTVYVVTDDSGPATNPDFYGVFSTRGKAESWIARQKERGYPWWNGLVISEIKLDMAKDLR